MLEQKIEKLTAAIETLTQAILAQNAAPSVALTQPATKAPVVQAVDTPAQEAPATQSVDLLSPSDQDLKDLTLQKSRDGFKDEIREKLNAYGAKKIHDLNGTQVIAFYDWLKTLGAN